MSYNCEPCEYTTENKTHYDEHLETDKHKRGGKKKHENGKYDCEACYKTFMNASSLSRHKKICDVDNLDPEAKIEYLKKKVSKLEAEKLQTVIKRNQEQTEKIQELEKKLQAKDRQIMNIVKIAGDIIYGSISAMTSAMIQFKNVSPLTKHEMNKKMKENRAVYSE